jgi:BASS family bile acid:Na+ symporter
MHILSYPASALAWLGRQGTRAVAVSIFLGLAVPQLAAFVKPLLGPKVFVLLTLSILRVDLAHLRDYFLAPKLITAATVWIMLISPLAIGGMLYFSGCANGNRICFW